MASATIIPLVGAAQGMEEASYVSGASWLTQCAGLLSAIYAVVLGGWIFFFTIRKRAIDVRVAWLVRKRGVVRAISTLGKCANR